MERWLYTTAGSGTTILSVPEIAGREISGRLYKDGIEFRPSANNGESPPDPMRKEFRHEVNLGKIHFAYELFGEEIDIPYKYEINET